MCSWSTEYDAKKPTFAFTQKGPESGFCFKWTTVEWLNWRCKRLPQLVRPEWEE